MCCSRVRFDTQDYHTTYYTIPEVHLAGFHHIRDVGVYARANIFYDYWED